MNQRWDNISGWIAIAIFFGLLIAGGAHSQQSTSNNQTEPAQATTDNASNRYDLRQPLVITAPSIQVVAAPTDQHDQQPRANERRWYSTFFEHPAEWLMALFNGLLVAVTGWLVFATVGLRKSTDNLWTEAERSAKRQESDTKILQRAYISVEPDGLHPQTSSIACTPTIEIVNVGKLPARDVRWTILSILDFDDRRPQSKLAITWPLEGEITLPPGARMKQGALEPRVIRHDTESLRPQVGLYVYVWGVVQYEDGFGNDRTTHFCHRYNCVNLKNVEADATAPKAFRYDSAAMIAKEHARYHRYGNDAT